MPNVKGVILTDRDRALLAYIGIARYASADQVHRLIAPEHSKKLVYRRLAKLCLPGGRLGEGACLRRLHYRRYEGTSVPVWALTPYGRSLVAPQLPWLPTPPAKDVGARFLEHTLLLNGVLLDLVLALRRSETAPLAELPFRWRAENDESLQFRALGHHLGELHNALLKPDAILEVPGRGRRLFIEAETGTQSIVTAQPERTGAILSKLQRYRQYFDLLSDDQRSTWYGRAFPDGLVPRLVFLVHSPDRRHRVERAVKVCLDGTSFPEFRARTEHRAFEVLVLTFGEAAGKLLGYFPDRVAELRAAVPRPTAPPSALTLRPATIVPPSLPAPRFALAVDERELRLLRDSLQRVDEALSDAYEAIDRHQRSGNCTFDLDGLPLSDLEFLRKLILRERPSTARSDAVGQ